MTYDKPAINAQVQALYLENLNRQGEPAGVDYYTQAVLNGATMSDVDAMMEASPEFAALNGAGGGGILGGNGRMWLLVGAVGLVAFLVIRRAKK